MIITILSDYIVINLNELEVVSTGRMYSCLKPKKLDLISNVVILKKRNLHQLMRELVVN